MEKTLRIEGMTCQHCVGRVKKFLEGRGDLKGVNVDLAKNEATFECDERTDVSEIVQDVTELGYPAADKG
ncbi:MAG: heavy-metal-associated domain-containing protein [Desulfobacteraceae bacterium]|nr:MAG: heavy-metal-associated domain-containing protein [Desulfobacteraceae bacterium]